MDNYIIKEAKDNGVKTIEEAFNFWMRKGYLNVSILGHYDIFLDYKEELKELPKPEAVHKVAIKHKCSTMHVYNCINKFV